jgi:hypothetical protein
VALNLNLLQNHLTDTNLTILKRLIYFLSAASSSRSSLSSSSGPLATFHLTALAKTRLLVVAAAYPTLPSTRI